MPFPKFTRGAVYFGIFSWYYEYHSVHVYFEITKKQSRLSTDLCQFDFCFEEAASHRNPQLNSISQCFYITAHEVGHRILFSTRQISLSQFHQFFILRLHVRQSSPLTGISYLTSKRCRLHSKASALVDGRFFLRNSCLSENKLRMCAMFKCFLSVASICFQSSSF